MNRKRNKRRLAAVAVRGNYDRVFGFMRGTGQVLGDIVSPDSEFADCELGIAFRDENDVPFGYDGKEVDMIEAVKNAR